MRLGCARLIAAYIISLAAAAHAVAGGIHIRYSSDAPGRFAETDIRYYQGVLDLEHRHPIAFALEHPFYVRMFEDPGMLDRLLRRWEAHEQRFEYWHDCLWKVLNGYRASHPALSELVPPSGPTGPIVVGRGGSSALGQELTPPSGGPTGTPVQSAAVPEPSSVLLLLLGFAASASCLAARAISRPSCVELVTTGGRGLPGA